MDLYEVCSRRVIARGFNYYKRKLVKNIEKIDDRTYSAIVKGTSNYHVQIDLVNYKKCKCSCPYDKKVCKHIVALYYELNPKEAESYEQILKWLIDDKKSYEKRKSEEYKYAYNNALKHVNSLSIQELKEELINYILDERYYNCLNEYDERYEEEFEILYEIDEDILEEIAHNKSEVIERTYPIHKLEDYIEAFEMIDGEDSWIDLETCEVYDDYYFEENDMDDEEIEDFYNNPNVISLPGRTELNEYEDMVSFVDSLTDDYIKEKLYNALKGKGAFKRFKNEIINQNVREKWFKYRDDCLRQKVINWLEENEIEYEE